MNLFKLNFLILIISVIAPISVHCQNDSTYIPHSKIVFAYEIKKHSNRVDSCINGYFLNANPKRMIYFNNLNRLKPYLKDDELAYKVLLKSSKYNKVTNVAAWSCGITFASLIPLSEAVPTNSFSSTPLEKTFVILAGVSVSAFVVCFLAKKATLRQFIKAINTYNYDIDHQNRRKTD